MALCGQDFQILRRLEALTGTRLVLRGLSLEIEGRENQRQRLLNLLELLRPRWQGGEAIQAVDLQSALHALDQQQGDNYRSLSSQELATTRGGRVLRPRTLTQKRFIERFRHIRCHDNQDSIFRWIFRTQTKGSSDNAIEESAWFLQAG